MKHLFTKERVRKIGSLYVATRRDGSQFEVIRKRGENLPSLEKKARSLGAVKFSYRGPLKETKTLEYYTNDEQQKFFAIDQEGNQEEVSPAEMAYIQMMQAVNSGRF